jgi:peptide/nickel transport system permease protein
MGYALRRLGFYLFAAIASITLNFLLPRLMPGDPASAMFARFQGQMQPEAMVALRESFGLNESSLLAQYGSYLKHVFTGDLGRSIAYYPTPVTEVIGTGLVWTLALTGVAVMLSFALGSLLGVLAAWRRSGWIDSVLPPLFAFIGAFPYFWLAMLALFVLGFRRAGFRCATPTATTSSRRSPPPSWPTRPTTRCSRRRPSCSRRSAAGCSACATT